MTQNEGTVEIFNVGSRDKITVKEIAMIVANAMGLASPKLIFNGGLRDGRGWVGDVKTMQLDVSKMKSIGWTPRLTSRDAVEQTVKSRLRGKCKMLATP